jgi:tellurite resistance protein TehA-like permease
MDWLAVLSLWAGALLFAIRSADLQAPAGAPPALTSGFWNVAPLGLLTLALILMILRALRGPRLPLDPVAAAGSPIPPRIGEENLVALLMYGGIGAFFLLLIIIFVVAVHWPVPPQADASNSSAASAAEAARAHAVQDANRAQSPE